VGLVEDVTSRDGIIASMQDVSLKQYLFLRNLAEPLIERLGIDEALAILDRAFGHYGQWRGETIRMSQASLVTGHDAIAFLYNWDSCDFVLAKLDSEVTAAGTPEKASLRVPRSPGAAYFDSRQASQEVLRHYWSGLVAGMARGYDPRLDAALAHGPDNKDWVITAEYSARPAGNITAEDVAARLQEIFARPAEALAMVRQTSRNAGALYMFIAREIIRAYDATGEQLVRAGVRGIGRERGNALKEKHLREGKPLNLKTLMLDWDGPLVSTWVFNDDGYLSEGSWHQDCVYCPYADVWGAFGPEGLSLGYLYDIELHTTMYETYYPGTVVRWDELKTRGDHLCKFRITIPELLSPNDPQYAGR
jgi:L-2-amino-thiazoline-4-carboxylic acid hydrolase-like protein